MTKALIIDDAIANLKLMEAHLSRYDIQAMGVQSGKEGYHLAQELSPDIIFVDLRMPTHTWDGYTTIKNMRDNAQIAKSLIVAITGGGSEADARQAGCDYFLQHPFGMRDIEIIIKEESLAS
ncbi:MAG: response regulator [Chloroflexota bacterium]